jgi:hypothetical protein
LTQTGVVYSRKISGKTYSFGVSGRLYKSNVIFYDHQTESLWSQLLSKAISGDMVRTELVQVKSSRVKWQTWRKKNPDTLVLSTDTGYVRDYSTDPYEGYYRIGTIWFPVGKVRKDLPPKARVLGLKIKSATRAYPLTKLQKEKGTITDQLSGATIRIILNDDGEVVEVADNKGKLIPHLFSFWFAWQAFNPETTVYGIK